MSEPFNAADEINNAETTSAADAIDHNLTPQDVVETAELNIEATILDPEETHSNDAIESSSSVEMSEPFSAADEIINPETTSAASEIDHNLTPRDDVETVESNIEATILDPEETHSNDAIESSSSVEISEPFNAADEIINAETTPAVDAIDHNLAPRDDFETAELNIEATILDPEETHSNAAIESSSSVEMSEPIETSDENTTLEIVDLVNANCFLNTELKHAAETPEIQRQLSREEIPSERLSETTNPPEVFGIPSATRQLPQPFVEHRDIYEALQTTLHVGINQKIPPLRRTSLSTNEDHSTRIHQDAISIEKNIVNKSSEDSNKNALGIAVRTDLVDAVFKSFDPKTTASKIHKLDK